MSLRTWLAVALVGGAVITGSGLAPAARGADGTASWVSAPADPPPTPPGGQPPPYALPIGYIGDIEFWAPNRGLLITAGNKAVPMGLYAYDGVSWHELSTVCGGTDGRIAWAGPDEFWTIADQRPGQVLPNGGSGALHDISLCHFDNGQVVGSYALPLDQPNSYQPMNAAACDAAWDCWFGGQLDAQGAFHLHWDGTNVSVVNDPADHEIASMTVDRGQIFESVQLGPTDSYTGENPAHPSVVHLIAPGDTGDPFHRLFLEDVQDPTCGDFCPPLPDYGSDSNGAPVAPVTLGGLSLNSDWSAGATDPQLWAAAGPDSTPPPQGQGTAHAVVLHYVDWVWTQVVPNLVSLPGNDVPVGDIAGATPTPEAVAAEPNQSAAWIAVVSSSAGPDGQAHVDRVAVNRSSATVTDQDVLGTAQGVGPRGNAAAISCPAAQDCWLGTDAGWLFHLTNGTQYPQDTDPNFAGVITTRPPDDGIPATQPVGTFVPTQVPPPPPVVSASVPTPRRRHAPPLITHMGHSRLVHKTSLELSFTLTKRAQVQLIGRRDGRTVAQTRRETLGAGRHTLELKLDPRRWPTALALHAKPA